MLELLLFFPVLILSGLVLSAIHFDRVDRILSYATENVVQLFVGALILCVLIYLVTPA